MPSNRTSNDIDLIQPTHYNVQPNRIAKKPPPEPWPLPDFTPLEDYGKPNLPPAYTLLWRLPHPDLVAASFIPVRRGLHF